MSDDMIWAVEEIDQLVLEIDRLREQNAKLCTFIKEIYAMRGENDVISKLCHEALDGGEE